MCKNDKDQGNAQSRAAWSRSVRPWASTELLAVRGKDPSESARVLDLDDLEMVRLRWRRAGSRGRLARLISALARGERQLM